MIIFFFKIFRRPDNFSRLCDTWWLIRKLNESEILSEPSLQRMGWPTHHLVSLECHRGPIHMTFRSGHGTHLRLISSLERWGSCQGSLQRMGWPTHHRYYNAKFKLFPSDGVVVATRWRFNTNDTWWSTYVNRLSKTCFVNITNHEAGNLNC